MKQKPGIFLILILFMTMIAVMACKLMFREDETHLEGTLAAQYTQLVELRTQAEKQYQIDQSQWDAISYLSTQMPFALELITPIPEGITITPTPWMDIEYPPYARTGITEIDWVIDAFLVHDVERRLELVRYIQYPCTSTGELGGPPICEEDEVEGTVVEAFPIQYSEGTHVRRDDLETVLKFSVRGLFAVYQIPEGIYETDYWPAGEYGIVFTSEEAGVSHTATVYVEAGRIVRLEFDLAWPPFSQILNRSEAFILPPSPRDQSPTPFAVCTPPACASNEAYHCPDECPGGCGTTCATVTPSP